MANSPAVMVERLFGRLQVPTGICRLAAEKSSPLSKKQDQSFAKRRKIMDRYLIETPHSGPECLDLVKLLNAQGYLWNFNWGCEAGIHTGWAIIDAEHEAQARLAVPPLVRSRARIIKLNKFDATTIEDCEKKEAAAAVSGGR
jgi:hypothetical protein